MSLPRIEVCDPTEEGNEIRSALREQALHVVRRDVEDFYRPSEAVAIVLAAEAEGALAVLKHLRANAAMTRIPVVLLGQPTDEPFDEDAARALGAHAQFSRPVNVKALWERIRVLLDVSREVPKSDAAGPPVTTFVGTLSGRERTMALQGTDAGPAYVGGAGMSTEQRLRSFPLKPVGPVADISPRLQALFEEADVRVFPEGPRLGITFAESDDSPDDLVPADLLDQVVNVLDMPEDDGLELMTFVGPMPAMTTEPRSTDGQAQSRATKNRLSQLQTDQDAQQPEFVSDARGSRQDIEVPPKERSVRRAVPDLRDVIPMKRRNSESPSEVSPSSAWRDIRTASIPTNGTYSRFGLASVFLRVVEERATGVLVLSAEGVPEIRLSFEQGVVRAMRTNVGQRVAESLRQDRMWTTPVLEEQATLALLGKRVATKQLTTFDLERRLARARVRAIGDAIVAPSGAYSWGPLGTRDADLVQDARRPFATAILVVVADVLRDRVSNRDAAAHLTSGTVRLLRDKARASSVFQFLPPELESWLLSEGPRSLDVLLEDAPSEEGVAGALVFLAETGFLEIDEEASVELSHEEAKTRVAALLKQGEALADDGDYFALLGLSRDATTREVHDAYEQRVRMWNALPLSDLGLLHVDGVRRFVLDAVRDAFVVLSDESVRHDYANSLFGVIETDAAPIALRPNG